MSDDAALVEEFFAEVNDKYYPQVLEGLELFGTGDVGQAVEVLARPLHTIKGVTGFMSGFEPASAYTHKVESYLKKLQSGDIVPDEAALAVSARAVNLIFTIIEQLKDTGGHDVAEADEILALLEGSADQGGPDRTEGASCCDVADRGGWHLFTVTCSRVHLPEQRDDIVAKLAILEQGSRVLLDLSATESFGSGAWEAVAELADWCDISVCGLNASCGGTFHSWGFDRLLRTFPSEREFIRYLEARAQ